MLESVKEGKGRSDLVRTESAPVPRGNRLENDQHDMLGSPGRMFAQVKVIALVERGGYAGRGEGIAVKSRAPPPHLRYKRVPAGGFQGRHPTLPLPLPLWSLICNKQGRNVADLPRPSIFRGTVLNPTP